MNNKIRKRVLAECGAVFTLHRSDLALLEGLDAGILKAGANRIAPSEDIPTHNVALVLNDGDRRANGLAVRTLVEELPHGEVTNQTKTVTSHFELLSCKFRCVCQF
jgi:hypothetical protein